MAVLVSAISSPPCPGAAWFAASLPVSALAVACLALVCLSLGLSAALLHTRRRRHAADQVHAAGQTALQDLVRLARLTAGDLRGAALTLHGLAQTSQDRTPTLPDSQRGALLSTQSLLLELAEALLRQTEAPGAHHLQEEAVRLKPMLDFVVAQLAGQLGPGRRAWRLADGLAKIELRADRRALHQVLLRVLTSAALATREGDWIAITGSTSNDHGDATWTLTVEDEGTGLLVESVSGKGLETRGLGTGLALAHRLMQAHGGTLTIESAARVGTRARLAFPATRLSPALQKS